MRILVLGATGLIGWHAARDLRAAGHEATGVSRHAPMRADEGVAVDVWALDDEGLARLLEGHDGVVLAMGADDRTRAPAPAYDFFHAANVITTARLVRAADAAGVGRLVVCGSYFTYFNRVWPELTLAARHPYVRARVEQAEVAQSGDVTGIVLELPYIFGTAPGRVPLWRPLVRYVNSPLPLVYTSGGSSLVAVTQVARAIRGALEQPVPQGMWPVGTHDLTWPRMLTALRADGRHRRVRTAPPRLVRPLLSLVEANARLHGAEHGLSPRHLVEFQCREAFFRPDDREASMAALGYGPHDLDAAFHDTVVASLA